MKETRHLKNEIRHLKRNMIQKIDNVNNSRELNNNNNIHAKKKEEYMEKRKNTFK